MTLTRKLAVAIGVVTLGWAAAITLWGSAPFAFSFDDAYYYFTIGRNWADGHASSFDMIEMTNGYHPLWQLICIVPFLVGLDGLAAVRALLIFQLALWFGAMLALARLVGDMVGSWQGLADGSPARRFCNRVTIAAFVLLAANPFLFTMTVNGLESGLVVPISAMLIVVASKYRGRFVSLASPSQRWITGVLVALAFLARTDAVILLAVIAVWCVLDRGKPPLPIGQRIRAFAELFTIPVTVIVTYLVVNQVVFGTALQISGVVKRLPITPTRAVLVAVWALIGIGVLVAARRPVRRTTRALFTRRFFAATGWYATFCIGLVGYYATLQQVPYLWYFAPLGLYATILVVLLVADLARSAALESGGVGSTAARVLPAGILIVVLTVGLVWTTPRFVDPDSWSLMVHDARAGRWIDENLPADARLASWDAGAVGYFAHRSVTNLDGVVNTTEWHDAQRNGTTNVFLAERNIGWVTNHGGDVDGRDPDIDAQLRRLFGDDQISEIVTVYADLYPFSGTLDGDRSNTGTKRMGSYVHRLGR